MRLLIRALKWMSITLLVIPVGCYLILFFINYQDSAPSTQAMAYLEQVKAEEEALSQHLEDNPYIYALGFDASVIDSPMARGLERYQAIRELGVMDRALQTAKDHFERPKWPITNCLSSENYLSECAVLLSATETLVNTLNEHAWLIERYSILLSMGQWQDDTNFNVFSDALPMQYFIAAQHLYLVDAYINERDSTDVIAALDQDFRFWMHAAELNNLLINKFFAIAALKQNLRLGEVLIGEMRQGDGHRPLPVVWQRPIPASVLSLERVKRGEWHFLTKMTRHIGADETAKITTKLAEALLAPLFQQQDTANRYAEMLTTEVSMEPCSDFLSLSALKYYAYNPMGKFILCTGTSSFDSYQATANELESLRSGLILRLEPTLSSL
ncbi:hypothetical protein KJI95_11095 [Shewanella sp. JM162201]|uniref:Uncharacterized protein n=1 Tax=Shewanella jiangmenensis TaxID=2837387 RepID=A0ABS5V3R9_9GAMM|nr:hypothetical protein [Shewanella jiangmenensis]MBT1445065.1 hypothetical protein [Shewanella jiangmenensis]